MIHDLTPSYWNERYLQNDFAWDLGEISQPLKQYFDGLTDKKLKILIPGAGNAYEAEHLYNAGFENVFVCDLARTPLDNLAQRCPGIKADHLLHGNFFELKNENYFDLIIEQTFFCALHPSLRKEYFRKMEWLLKPGGRLVGLLFNDKLNSDKPPFGGNKDEYLACMGDLFIISKFEECHNSIKPRSGRELFMNLRKRNPIIG